MDNPLNPNESENASRRNAEALQSGIEDCDLRIEVFAVCESACEQQGRLSILGTFELLGALRFPVTIPQLTIVVRFRVWPSEAIRQDLRINLTDPDGRRTECFAKQGECQSQSTDRSVAYNLIATVSGLEIGGPGEYTFDFYRNQTLEGRLPICVYASEP